MTGVSSIITYITRLGPIVAFISGNLTQYARILYPPYSGLNVARIGISLKQRYPAIHAKIVIDIPMDEKSLFLMLDSQWVNHSKAPSLIQ